MRAPGILLLVLAVLATLTYPYIKVSKPSFVPASGFVAPASTGEWRYSSTAGFYDVLTRETQAYSSDDPENVARRVCGELGGSAGFVQSPKPGSRKVEFLCQFVEPDVTMHVEFGELRRIPEK